MKIPDTLLMQHSFTRTQVGELPWKATDPASGGKPIRGKSNLAALAKAGDRPEHRLEAPWHSDVTGPRGVDNPENKMKLVGC